MRDDSRDRHTADERRCDTCSVRLWPGESAKLVAGAWTRVDRCTVCFNQGAPPGADRIREAAGVS